MQHKHFPKKLRDVSLKFYSNFIDDKEIDDL